MADIAFSISGIAFLNDSGEWIDVPLETTVDSSSLCKRQMKLSEFYLPAGKYQQIKWNISEATVKRGANFFSLALPEPEGEHVLDIGFVVFRRESLALFVGWDPEESIFNKYLFKPKMAAREQHIEIKRILAYVTNTDSNSVTVIERQRDLVVGTIAVGRRPKGIVAKSNGTKVFVANAGSNSISVIDTDARKVTNTISNFGYSPAELALSTDGQVLYATNPDSDNVSVFDVISETVSSGIKVGRRPVAIAYDGERSKIYVANRGDNSISIIDVNTASVESTVTVGLQPFGLAVQDDKLYVANTGSNTISVIQLGSYAVVKTVEVGQMPMKALSGLPGWIYVTNGSNNEVSLYYRSMDIITKNLSVGDFPTNMALDSLRRKLYVVNSLADTVSVVDLVMKKVKRVMEVGRKPHGIASVEE
jgi:YVTN family beta-propeller protein